MPLVAICALALTFHFMGFWAALAVFILAVILS